MKIQLNGHASETAEAATIADLLQAEGLEKGQIAVAVNLEFIPRDQYETHQLNPDDAIEVVAPMQGG
jgi:sulfur carrier protein